MRNLHLISGPGCPVCVTGNKFVDTSIALSRKTGVIITTFGDMMRVPGSSSSLAAEKLAGADISIVYSPIDALKIARENQGKTVVFLGVGFETTAPTIAVTIKKAYEEGIKNFFVLCAHKTMPEALAAIVGSGELSIHGFICPGHVSTITGIHIYDFIAEKHNVPCVVSGFEPLDIVNAIYLLCSMISEKKSRVVNGYKRVVRENGNETATALMNEVFEEADEDWRGIGIIPGSGLKIKEKYKELDALLNIPVEVEETKEPSGCRCGEILKGVIIPPECPLFRKKCTTENPVGACMVSSEGTCAAYYKYHSE